MNEVENSNAGQGTHLGHTVEPLNNVTFGTSYSVHYREVSFLRRL